MTHPHIPYAANEWLKEVTKQRHPIPHRMLSVMEDIMKPDNHLETAVCLSGDANVVQSSVAEERFVGTCRRLLIELRRRTPREDAECMLVGLRKARRLKINANVVCQVDCGVGAPSCPCVPFVKWLFELEIHGSANLKVVCCVLRSTWCRRVCFSCYLHQKRGTINVRKFEFLTSHLV